MGTSSTRPSIVFDLDGTLVEVGARDFAVYRDLLIEDGLTPLPFSRYWQLRRERTPLVDVLAETVEQAAGYVSGYVERREIRYEAVKYLDLDTVLPTVQQTLASLSGRFECVLITSRRQARATEQQLVTLGLREHLRQVHCCDGEKTATVGLVENVALVVGDTEHDVRIAAHYGYRCFAVTTGIRSRQFLIEAGPTFVGDSLEELLRVL